MYYFMLLSMQVFVIDQFIFSFIINTAWPFSISSKCQTFLKNSVEHSTKIKIENIGPKYRNMFAMIHCQYLIGL